MAYYSICPSVPGHFFVYMDGLPLTRDRLVTAVRQALARAGMDISHYSGHSFRVGAATTASQAGLSDATVKMLGRWQLEAYQRYIRTPRESLAAISRHLAN
jgi:site-specific recombinase XerD